MFPVRSKKETSDRVLPRLLARSSWVNPLNALNRLILRPMCSFERFTAQIENFFNCQKDSKLPKGHKAEV